MLTRWRLGSWLMQRWNIDPINLVQCVIEGLPVYHPETLVNIFPWPQSDGRMLFCFPPLREGPWSVKTLSAIIHMCQFKQNEVEKFETKHPNILAQAQPSNSEDIEALLGEAPSPVSKEPSTIETAPNQGENFFIFDGYHWRVGFKGQEKSIKGTNGVWYISHLLANPNKKISVYKLTQLVNNPVLDDRHEPYRNMGSEQLNEEGLNTDDSSTIIKSSRDRKFEADTANIKEELEDALDRAIDSGISEKIEEAQEELEKFRDARALHEKKDDPPSNKPRTNVQKRIQTAIANIKQTGLQELSYYLTKHIFTGVTCEYSPDPENPMDWNIKFQTN